MDDRKKFTRPWLVTHGLTLSRTYKAYHNMLARCYNPKNTSYKNYGAKGIGVCDSWKACFENFLADMHRCPDHKTLDRIDNDKGYSPENCRWSTWDEQSINKKNSIRIGEISNNWKVIRRTCHRQIYRLECLNCGVRINKKGREIRPISRHKCTK